jgi:hypothetical protein
MMVMSSDWPLHLASLEVRAQELSADFNSLQEEISDLVARGELPGLFPSSGPSPYRAMCHAIVNLLESFDRARTHKPLELDLVRAFMFFPDDPRCLEYLNRLSDILAELVLIVKEMIAQQILLHHAQQDRAAHATHQSGTYALHRSLFPSTAPPAPESGTDGGPLARGSTEYRLIVRRLSSLPPADLDSLLEEVNKKTG